MRRLTNIDIILSLVRTRSIGYLRDIRRLTVALSRARLGLYILGRRAVFESVFELKPAFDILFQRPDKLALVTDEMYGETTRAADAQEVEGEAVMEGVEHLGKYVYDMQNAKFEALKANGGQLPTREVKMVDANGVVDDDEDGEENVLIPEEQVDDFGQDDDDEEPEVQNTGRHLEIEATSTVRIG
jgi:intron-binding protein aquarius